MTAKLQLLGVGVMLVMATLACGGAESYVPPPTQAPVRPTPTSPPVQIPPELDPSPYFDLLAEYGFELEDWNIRGEQDCGADMCLFFIDPAASYFSSISVFIEDGEVVQYTSGESFDLTDAEISRLAEAMALLSAMMGMTHDEVDCIISNVVPNNRVDCGKFSSLFFIDDEYRSFYLDVARVR